MSSYGDRKGVWVTYGYDGPAYVMALHEDVVPAARECARNHSGKVLFWPYGMTFQAAVEEWERPETDDIERVYISEQYPMHVCHTSPIPWGSHFMTCPTGEHPDGWVHMSTPHSTCTVCLPNGNQ